MNAMTSIYRGICRGRVGRRAVLGGALAAAAVRPSRAQGVKTFDLSNHVPPAHNVAQASVKFADLVRQRSNGQIVINVHHAAQLAGLREAAEGVQLGTLDMAWVDFATFANWQPYYGVFVLPFLFKDFDHVFRVQDGPIGVDFKNDLRARLRTELLAWGPTGFRVMVTNRRAIRQASDLQGLKIRVPEIPVFVETFRALGANPTPMAIGETYTALQTGVIDGMEAPAEAHVTFRLQEVTRYASRTYHMFTDMNLCMNQGKFNALSSAEQQLMLDCAREVVIGWYRPDVVGNDVRFWGVLTERMEKVDNPDIASFRTATAGVYDSFTRQTGTRGRDLVEGVRRLANP